MFYKFEIMECQPLAQEVGMIDETEMPVLESEDYLVNVEELDAIVSKMNITIQPTFNFENAIITPTAPVVMPSKKSNASSLSNNDSNNTNAKLKMPPIASSETSDAEVSCVVLFFFFNFFF